MGEFLYKLLTKFARIGAVGVVMTATFLLSGVVYADTYGAGSYGTCKYSINCGGSNGILPDTGSLLLIISGIIVLAAGIVLFIFARRRRKRMNSMKNVGDSAVLPPNTTSAVNPMGTANQLPSTPPGRAGSAPPSPPVDNMQPPPAPKQ